MVNLMKVKVDHIYISSKIIREVDSLQSRMRDLESPAGRCLMSWKGGKRYAPTSIDWTWFVVKRGEEV